MYGPTLIASMENFQGLKSVLSDNLIQFILINVNISIHKFSKNEHGHVSMSAKIVYSYTSHTLDNHSACDGVSGNPVK